MSTQFKSACMPRVLVCTVDAHAGLYSVHTVHTPKAQVTSKPLLGQEIGVCHTLGPVVDQLGTAT